MKSIYFSGLLAIAMLGMSNQVLAQDSTKAARPKPQTLFSNEPLKVSGFGAPILEWSSMAGQSVFSMGGGAAVLLNDFFIGGYGQGLTSTVKVKDDQNKEKYLTLGHGGLWFGAAIKGSKLVHPIVAFKTGWGGINLRESAGFSPDSSFYINNAFFAFTPELGLELNVAAFFRINANVGYRMVIQSEETVLTDEELSSLTGNLTLKFGWFR